MLSTQVSLARQVNDGAGVSAVYTQSLSTYVVAFDDMPQAGSQTAHDQVALQVKASGGEVVYTYTLVDAMAVRIPDSAVGQVASVPGVKSMTKDYPVHISMDQVVNQTDVRNIWTDANLNQKYGTIDGSGINICIIDTGVDDTHPDLKGKVVLERDFTVMTGDPGTIAKDNNGHGTFIASEIAGSGVSSMNATGGPGIYLRTINGYENLAKNDPNYTAMRGPFKGIATGANLMCFKVAGATGDAPSSIVEMALDYATNKSKMPGGRLPDIISMSLNSGVPDPLFTQYVENAIQKGIVVVISAGNTGPTGTVEAPADAPSAITVGSVARNDTVSFFSSHGPAPHAVAKPDIMGVGETVIAAKPVLNNGVDSPLTNYSNYYMVDRGTSMATPEVAAVAALMLQINPSLKPSQVKELLMDNARKPAGYTPQASAYYGAGIVDAYATLMDLTNGNIPSIPSTPNASISFEQQTYQVDENSKSLNVVVDANWDPSVLDGKNVTVKYEALSGSGDLAAISGIDYNLNTGTLTFQKQGARNQLSIPVTILDDNIPGNNKNFNIRLSSMDNVAIGEPSTTVTILDSDYSTVRFAVNGYTVTNGAGIVKVDVLANRWGNSQDDIKVNVNLINGTAVYGKDFTWKDQPVYAPVTLDFGTGSKQSLYLTINNPTSLDTKAFTITLSDPVKAELGSPSSDPVWIMASGSNDKTPPSTSYAISPASPNGNNGWYNSNVTVQLSSSDTGGSTVDHICYSLNDGDTVQVAGSTATINITSDGKTTVKYWAVDGEGNTEAAKALPTISVDKTCPVITYLGRTPADKTWINKSVTMTFNNFDPTSGVSASTITKTVPSPVPGDWNNGSVTVTAQDKAGNTQTLTVNDNIYVDMLPPVLGTIKTPTVPLPINSTITVNDTFTDTSGLASATWSWDDGSPDTAATIDNVKMVVNGTHRFTAPGTYTIGLNVTDKAGNKNSTTFDFVVIYDPNAGAVIGVGGFNSPAGAYAWKPAKSGPAAFGFASAYVTVKKVTTLQGITEFMILNGLDPWFQSSSYDWLVVSGSKAIYQGTGKFIGNGSKTYKFVLSTIDSGNNNQWNPPADKFRIKIWDSTTGAVVYDNQPGAANDADPTQLTTWGNILIYKP
ncbi:MAG TPA: S8 family serine peptidase [Methanocella sp.]|uniref:S8 family serine peptidase n=1 Tax=Methanocella sp. TaxID=2052833 RepID=UPI002C6F359C|nr:S8 family serine peptidase [Methanocella sp.]HTY90368.1 S8 family serine peptidase [Methanocella sp.]